MNTPRKSQNERELGTTMTEVVVFTAIIVGSLVGAIFFLQESSEERIKKGQAVFSAYELEQPSTTAARGGGGHDSDDPVVIVPPPDDGAVVEPDASPDEATESAD